MSSPYGQLLSAKNKTKKTRYWQGGDKYFRAAEQPSSNICCAVSCSPVVSSLRGLKKKKKPLMVPPEQSGSLSLTIRLSCEIQRLIKSYFRFNKRHLGQTKSGRGRGWRGGTQRNSLKAFVHWRIKWGALWLLRRWNRLKELCSPAVHFIVCRGQKGRRGGRHRRETNQISFSFVAPLFTATRNYSMWSSLRLKL